ncbi:MAG: radical SAM protein [Chloroflexota bacterium]
MRAGCGDGMIAFGPVPSRRLGRSLGINNIPPKVCTYSCVYCQLGRTDKMKVERREFFALGDIVEAVSAKVRQVHARGERIDYLTFVPDGEPTLDAHLGQEILALRSLGHKIAVISNASLIHLAEVRADLALADWVSLKIDATDERMWRRIDRPHRSLRSDELLEGMLAFAEDYDGRMVTETMLVSGLNDGSKDLVQLAEFLGRLKPSVAYLSIPTRPPAEGWVRAPDEATLHLAHQIVHERVDRAEFLVGYEGNAFSATGDTRQDLLSITAVHPMRADAVEALLHRNGDAWSKVERMLQEHALVELTYQGERYYMRRLHPVDDRPVD